MYIPCFQIRGRSWYIACDGFRLTSTIAIIGRVIVHHWSPGWSWSHVSLVVKVGVWRLGWIVRSFSVLLLHLIALWNTESDTTYSWMLC